ncbi:MAG TPA: alcohol dehydrogenase catalytic domain-containing protein [Planctomycetota bacterium]|nr:alcohol dehydrogenase catalytic domain-containing protein [Planctomycetota bacterium]
MKARAALADGKGSFFIDDIELADPQAGEILVEIRASGVCHTDYKILRRQPVLVMGHEGAGVVLKAGPGVSHVAPGDRVLLNWAMPCGKCFSCTHGLQNVCENKPCVPKERIRHRGEAIGTSFNLGTMSTATVVPAAAAVKMDVDIPFTSACILGCCVMTGVGSVQNVANVPRGASVAVIGTGAVGICTIQGARIAGARRIIGVDVNPTKLKLAERFGMTHAVLADRSDEGLINAAQKVKALTEGRGADYAFECTSIPALGAAPLAMVRNGGTAVQISGIEEKVKIDMELFEWDKIYINPLYGKCDPPRDFPELLRLYASKQLLLDEMVTGVYALDELPRAFEDMHKGVNAKAVLRIGS